MANERNNRGNLPIILIALAVGIGFVIFSNLPENKTKDADPAVAENVQETPVAANQVEEAPKRPFSGDGFVLSFRKNFKPGLASLDDLGLSVVILVDLSGSMADPPAKGDKTSPKYMQASRALASIVDVLKEMRASAGFADMKLKVGVLGFNTNVREIFPMTTVSSESLADLRKIFETPANLLPDAKTAIGLAIERGAEMLLQSGTIMKSMIVVTDGENTVGPDPKDVLWAINENRNNASTVEFPVLSRGILVSFVGFDIDAGLFDPLKDEGARVTAAADQKELQNALRKVLIADITRLEAKN